MAKPVVCSEAVRLATAARSMSLGGPRIAPGILIQPGDIDAEIQTFLRHEKPDIEFKE